MPETFQYQKGAIKTSSTRASSPSGSDFNTKKVRLKRKNSGLEDAMKMIFQYQKGAIKTFLCYSRKAKTRRRFQYQKGAIKTIMSKVTSKSARTFQYQKGAIKTIYCEPFCGSAVDFNTKKVRLKRSSTHAPTSSRSWDFNTKKVRLKRARNSSSRPSWPRFQYQKGAIKTQAL